MRYFSARSPKSCDVGHAMNDVSPCTPSLYATGKIDNGAPSADFVVHQSVEQMVEALVRADVHMDTMSNKELGVEAHDVPADGDCMLHAWIKAAENVTGTDLPCFLLSLRALRERLAQFFEEHAQQLEAYHNKYGQWGWGRPDWKWVNWDSPPNSVSEYVEFLRTPRAATTGFFFSFLFLFPFPFFAPPTTSLGRFARCRLEQSATCARNSSTWVAASVARSCASSTSCVLMCSAPSSSTLVLPPFGRGIEHSVHRQHAACTASVHSQHAACTYR